MTTRQDTEDAVYAAMKRRANEEELGPVGRWIFLACVGLVGVGIIALVLYNLL